MTGRKYARLERGDGCFLQAMTSPALILLLIAAVLHATWNYWAKRAGGGLPFVYLISLSINAAYVPVVVFYFWRYDPTLSGAALLAILGSGGLKTAYSLYLQRGYRQGDFSVIYPLARGTGPLLSTFTAIIFLGERPSLLALTGGLVVVASIFWMTGGIEQLCLSLTHRTAAKVSDASSAVRYGLVSGVFIAAYTLWDRQGVAYWLIPPILYDAGTALTQLLLLTPTAWGRRAEIAQEWRVHRKHALIIAGISPVSYILVLTALRFTPVSYVAPAREVSILIGAFFGVRFLNEAGARRRLWAAGTMAAGVIALALG